MRPLKLKKTLDCYFINTCSPTFYLSYFKNPRCLIFIKIFYPYACKWVTHFFLWTNFKVYHFLCFDDINLRALFVDLIIVDPSMMTDMLKGNLTNVLPMIVIGGWINWAFSGFLTSKLSSAQLTFNIPEFRVSKFIMALDHRSLASHKTYCMFKSNTYTINTQGATTLHITINITV